MGKGYAEGSAVEERLAALERGDGDSRHAPERKAVYGSTTAQPEKHFLGWLGEIDPDKLFDSGKAWGISIIRRRG